MNSQSELGVIVKAKDLCSYIMIITQKSPKHFRYTFVSRMQNLSLDIIEKIYRANDVFFNKNMPEEYKKRLEYQHEALTSIRVLAYFSQLAMEQGCILGKQC
ncbi:MAG: four helix bundle protein [Ruminococcus sp.]|nr:four helix bundle protein [Ruminococcus sp.]